MAEKQNTKKAAPAKAGKNLVSASIAAGHCGVTVRTLASYKAKYADMPIEEMKPGHKGGWKVDLDKLDAWRKRTGVLNGSVGSAVTSIREKIKPEDPRHTYQAELLKISLQERRGELIPREDVEKEVSTMLAELATMMDRIPDKVGAKLKLKPDTINAIRKEMDACREAMARGERGFFEKRTTR